MTKEHLIRIVNCINSFHLSQQEFDSLFTSNYNGLPIHIDNVDTYLLFNHQENGMAFKKGRIGCSGVFLDFSHSRFENINVQVLYDYFDRKIYNSVLATPKYTDSDWKGKKRIAQIASKVKCNKDMQKIFARMYKRFECPTLK